MKNGIRALTYILSAWISIKFASDYWVIGPVFGLTVVVWDSDHVSHFLSRKHILFVAISALIYALVLHIIMSEYWRFDIEILNDFFGTFSAGVITGSLLLPATHSLLLGSTKRTNAQASIALIVFFYLIILIGSLSAQLKLSIPFDIGDVVIAVWQAVYLACFFVKATTKACESSAFKRTRNQI